MGNLISIVRLGVGEMYLGQSEVLKRIQEKDKVLDIGGWDKVFPRANVVIDYMPYETRRNHTGLPERFSEDSWIQGDVHDKKIWERFPDQYFDFAIAAHILEDIRDPIGVLEQLLRVSKAGYIEVPSAFREISKLDSKAKGTGYDHHRWIVWYEKDLKRLNFKPKLGWAFERDLLSEPEKEFLSDYHYQFDSIFWNQSLRFQEIVPNGWENESAWLDSVIRETLEGPKPRQYLFDTSSD